MVLRELGPNLGGGDENFAMVHVRIRYFLVFFFGTCNGCKFGNVMTSVEFLNNRPPTKMMIRHGDDDAGKAAANFAD